MASDDLKEKLSHTVEMARETATSAMDTAAAAGETIKSGVKTHATEPVEALRQAAGERANAARDTLVDAGQRLADTRHGQADVADGAPARLPNGLASGVTSVTEGLRDRTIGDIFASAQSYAGRNPGTFAVGATVAGLAVVRFLRSSGDRARAETRAAKATDRFYRDAARRTLDNLGLPRDGGPQA